MKLLILLLTTIPLCGNIKAQGTVTDRDGNIYKTIKIGTQIWMASNLNTTKYRNGDRINNLVGNYDWQSAKTGAWCYYNNKSSYCTECGKLYNWFALNDDRSICPKGWHIPSLNEWFILKDYVADGGGGGDKIRSKYGWEKYDKGWKSFGNGNNNSGFNILPNGIRNNEGAFSGLHTQAYYWSSTYKTGSGYYFPNSIQIFAGNSITESFLSDATVGQSCRCVKD